MRDRVGTNSAKEAFETFWSREYFSENPWSQEIAFFNEEIEPLVETNYFRRIDFDGAPLDWFWKIDLWFIGLFVIELLARSFYLSRRYKNFTWLDAVLTRWYDLLLIIPFSAMRLGMLALLRVIPVAVRLDRSRLVDMEPVRNRVNRFLISQIAIELTEVVVLRILDQMQNLVRNGDVARTLMAVGGRRYIDINGVDEVQIIVQRLSEVVVNQVLPQIKPEVDAILNHNVNQIIGQAPAYQALRQVPGLGSASDQLTQQLVSQVSAGLYDALQGALADDKGAALTQALILKFGETLRSEVQQNDTVSEVQDLTVDLIEEIKLNYVKQVAAEDWEVQEEKRYRLYDATQEGK